MTLALAWRSLKRTPVFTLVVIGMLWLGTAAAGALFAILHGVLLAPLPYREPERLVGVRLEAAELRRMGHSPALQSTWERHARSLAGVGLYRSGGANVRAPGAADAENVASAWVSASLLPLLGVAPLLGRNFDADEERRGGPDAVILSESEWRSRYRAAAEVLGQILIVNDVPRAIVGVMPDGFAFPFASTRLWLPLKRAPAQLVEDGSYACVARLAAGVTPEQAQAELATLLPRLAEDFPRLGSGEATTNWLAGLRPIPQVLRLREALTGEIARMLWMLSAAAGLVLLVAWANVANLMLVRADSRRLELAVRLALGAGRLRLAGHCLAEALLLGAISGLLALLTTHAALRALVAFGPADLPRLHELGLGLPATGFIGLLALAAVLLCAAVPLLHARSASLSGDLREGARGASSGPSRQRLRAGIVVIQIAAALVVVLGCGLLLRSAQRLNALDPGFRATDVVTLRTLLPHARYRDASSVDFHARLTERVARLPSVQAAGLAWQLPLAGGGGLDQNFHVDPAAEPRTLPVNVIGNGYFAALRIPLLAGRDFHPLDAPRSGELILSRSAARALFGNGPAQAALGQTLRLTPQGPGHTVVGVVGDVLQEDLARPAPALVYLPQAVAGDPGLGPGPRASMALVVRSEGPQAAVLTAIRQILHELDPSVPVFELRPMQELLHASTARLRLALALLSAAAVVALLIGAIGLYGVLACLMALRRREFGVRLALGASPQQIGWLVLRHGLLLAGCGIGAGLLLFVLAAPLLRTHLYGVTAGDPPTLIVATLAVLGTALAASWLPARRAARLAPAQGLGAD